MAERRRRNRGLKEIKEKIEMLDNVTPKSTNQISVTELLNEQWFASYLVKNALSYCTFRV